MSSIYPKMLALYQHMRPRMKRARSKQPNCANVLPPEDFDFAPLFVEKVPKDLEVPDDGKRRDMIRYREILRSNYLGNFEILPFHMLLNAYLRRDTPWNGTAKHLFFRLWREHGEALIEIIPTRDLISALRTFGEFSDDPRERHAARTAFVYATLLKAYESERKMENSNPRKARYGIPFRATRLALGVRGLAFADDDGVAMINFMVARDIENLDILGMMILLLLTRIYERSSIFSRMDRARIEAEFDLDRTTGWSWGFNPRTFDPELVKGDWFTGEIEEELDEGEPPLPERKKNMG